MRSVGLPAAERSPAPPRAMGPSRSGTRLILGQGSSTIPERCGAAAVHFARPDALALLSRIEPEYARLSGGGRALLKCDSLRKDQVGPIGSAGGCWCRMPTLVRSPE